LNILLIVTGPVGGGKSTTSQQVARVLQSKDVSTAVIDLDEVYCMARQQPGFDDRQMWTTARHAAAALTESFFASGLRAVIVEGGFLSALEYSELRRYITSEVDEFFFTLFTSPSTALHRAQADPNPDRVMSRLPEVQRALYAEFSEALPFLRDASTVIEADLVNPEFLAEIMAKTIFQATQH
jgi:shikimate kinase